MFQAFHFNALAHTKAHVLHDDVGTGLFSLCQSFAAHAQFDFLVFVDPHLNNVAFQFVVNQIGVEVIEGFDELFRVHFRQWTVIRLLYKQHHENRNGNGYHQYHH